MTDKPKHAGGRPTKYIPEFCDTVIEMGKSGASKAEMALDLDIVMSTFDVWQNTIPEFSEAVKEAERLSQGWWEKNGRIATFGGVQGFNATSYAFNMKNRFKDDWRDKVEQEIKSEAKHEHTIRELPATDDWIKGIIGAGTKTPLAEPVED